MMRYKDLHSLIGSSKSSRNFFLSLTVPMQLKLHCQGENIHTAQDLRRYAELTELRDRADEISRTLF